MECFYRMTLRKSLVHSCLFQEEDGVQGLKVKGQYKLWDKERREKRDDIRGDERDEGF
jgi:hypothetical protein